MPTWGYLTIIAVAEAVVTWSYNHFVFTRDLVMTVSAGQLDLSQAARMLHLAERFQWLGYVAIVPSLFVRITLAALVLQFAVLFFDSVPTSFGIVFRAAVIAHVAKVGESVINLLWTLQVDGADRTARFLAGSPLSLGVFVAREGALGAFKPVVDSVSIGNVAWIVIAAAVLARHLRVSQRSLMITSMLAWAAMLVIRIALYQTMGAMAS